MNKRPEWNLKISEELARWFFSNDIIKITHHWKFTGEDTAESWICCHPEKGSPRKFPYNFFDDRDNIFKISPTHRGLISCNPWHEKDLRRKIDKIDRWTKKNKRDLSEYKRLKEKFES